MARITVEDCLTQENNRFALVQLAAKRTKQLLGGAKQLVPSTNKSVVTALREIASGQVRFMTAEETAEALEKEEAAKKAIFEQPILAPMSISPSIEEILGVSSDDDDDEEEIIDDEEDDDDEDDVKKPKSDDSEEETASDAEVVESNGTGEEEPN